MQIRLNTLIKREAERIIEVNERGVPVEMSVAAAVLKSLTVKAVKGQVSAQRLFLEAVNAAETMELAEKQEAFRTAVHYKQKTYAAIREADANGDPEPQILPHPDDISVNERTLEVLVHGPKDDGEKKEWDLLWADMEASLEAVEDRREKLTGLVGDSERAPILLEIEAGLFVFKSKALDIMRRWKLPAGRLVDDCRLQAQLDMYVAEGTNPASPFTSNTGDTT